MTKKDIVVWRLSQSQISGQRSLLSISSNKYSPVTPARAIRVTPVNFCTIRSFDIKIRRIMFDQ